MQMNWTESFFWINIKKKNFLSVFGKFLFFCIAFCFFFLLVLVKTVKIILIKAKISKNENARIYDIDICEN